MEFPETKRKKFSSKQRLECFVKHGALCYLCETKIKPGEEWQIEHILPVALGGSNEDENLRPVHVHCHKPKTKDDVGKISKANRLRAKHFGAKEKKGSMPGSKKSGWKRKMDGTVVRRDDEEN